MFTGIVEEIGSIHQIASRGQSMVIRIKAQKVLADVQLGDSIAVNGVCLTVTAFDSQTITMDVMPETYRHTNLHQLSSGSRVNLERAMAAGGRFGGHLMQGHVDGTAVIVSRQPEENAVIFELEPHDSSWMKYIVQKGSVALDGISLTVAHAGDSSFKVSIIPHTLAETTMMDKQIGDIMNVECDLIGKYVERLLNAQLRESIHKSSRRGITDEFLAEHGFV